MKTKEINEIECAALEVLRSTGVDILEAALVAKEALECGRGRVKRARECGRSFGNSRRGCGFCRRFCRRCGCGLCRGRGLCRRRGLCWL